VTARKHEQVSEELEWKTCSREKKRLIILRMRVPGERRVGIPTKKPKSLYPTSSPTMKRTLGGVALVALAVASLAESVLARVTALDRRIVGARTQDMTTGRVAGEPMECCRLTRTGQRWTIRRLKKGEVDSV